MSSTLSARAPLKLPAHDRPLARTAWLMLALAAVTVALMAIDPRLFNGVSTWLKPLKFQLSLAVFLGTLALIMGQLTPAGRESRLAAAIRWFAIPTSLFEIAYIMLRAGLNEASHFNDADALGRTMFTLMGLAALFLTATAGLLAILTLRHARPAMAPIRLYVASGLMISAVLGIYTGAVIGDAGSHWVGGAPTDAGGLPLVSWVRDGGDLRVAHFFALHAMQIFPLLGLALIATSAIVRHGVLAITATAYTACVLALLWQAQRGEPFLPGLMA
ncbi:MAG: hypothetical protein AAF318_18155 [Pseudomonadota bacterium]